MNFDPRHITAEQSAQPLVATPPTASGRPSKRRRRWPLIVALVAVVALVVGGGVFWFLSSRQKPFVESVRELDASVSAAETSAREAQEAVSAYASELTRTGAQDREQLKETAQKHVDALNRSLERAREVVPKAREAARSGGAVPDSLRQEVRLATTQVDDAVGQVKRDLPKMKSEQKRLVALPTKIPRMNIEQIGRGDYSSIQGVWTVKGDRSHSYIEVTGNTITWKVPGEDEPIQVLHGLRSQGRLDDHDGYDDGDGNQMMKVDLGRSVTHGSVRMMMGPIGSSGTARFLGFYARGKAIDNLKEAVEDGPQVWPSDTSVDRIVIIDNIHWDIDYDEISSAVATRDTPDQDGN